jgi:hypothetical protein
MPTVRFTWDALLVEIRRQACPQAKWDKATRSWVMTSQDATGFIAAAHDRLCFARVSGTVAVDAETWQIGFIQGAPCRVPR